MEVKSVPARLTPAELNRLGQAASMIDRGDLSAVWSMLPRGWLASSVQRTCERLCAKGMLKPYVHGGYLVTDAGRAVLAAARQDERTAAITVAPGQ